MLISDQGTLIRTPVSEISVFGRNTQGVRLVNLNESEHLAGLERIVEIADDGEGDVADKVDASSDNAQETPSEPES